MRQCNQEVQSQCICTNLGESSSKRILQPWMMFKQYNITCTVKECRFALLLAVSGLVLWTLLCPNSDQRFTRFAQVWKNHCQLQSSQVENIVLFGFCTLFGPWICHVVFIFFIFFVFILLILSWRMIGFVRQVDRAIPLGSSIVFCL